MWWKNSSSSKWLDIEKIDKLKSTTNYQVLKIESVIFILLFMFSNHNDICNKNNPPHVVWLAYIFIIWIWTLTMVYDF